MISENDFQEQKKYIDLLKQINKNAKTTKEKTACVITYGCQQNVADSEKIKGILDSAGYVFSDDINDCNLIIYNTCAVRENAEDRVFGNTGKLKHLKKANKDLIICLCGCMIQQEHVTLKMKKSYPQVDLMLGTHSIHLLPQHLYKAVWEKVKVVDIENRDGIFPESVPIFRDDKEKAWVPIMCGCDNFCTYCVVPYVRGREYSRKPKDIIAEVENLVSQGYKEIVLLGQNVNSYGKGLEEQVNFSDLLRKLNSIPGRFEIGFMTSHPKDCTKQLIDTIASCEKVSKHLHLPVQSGSNRILKLMNRKYSIEQYKELVDYAKSKIKNLVLSSDIIVGFPGEKYEDFVKTKEIIEYVKYDFLFNFIYSKRVGTVAANMPDNVSAQEKHRWFSELLQLQERLTKTGNLN